MFCHSFTVFIFLVVVFVVVYSNLALNSPSITQKASFASIPESVDLSTVKSDDFDSGSVDQSTAESDNCDCKGNNHKDLISGIPDHAVDRRMLGF